MPDSSLAQIAAELYAGPPDRFVDARNARVEEAVDRSLAAQIRALRKPSIAAWVVNVFAHERAAELGQALQLAEELREAQADLDAATLATLGRQRRALTGKLTEDAVALATTRGGRVSASTAEAVRQTITAAFFDPDAAAAVASGRLVRELEPSVALDLDAVVAGGAPTSPVRTPLPVDEVNARRERRRAEAAVGDAEQHLLRAQRDRAQAAQDVRELARHVQELVERERALDAELARVREQLEGARTRAPDLDDRTHAAEAATVAAERALETARRTLLQASGPAGASAESG